MASNTLRLEAYSANTLSGALRMTATDTMNVNPAIKKTSQRFSWHIVDGTSRSNDATNAPSFDAAVLNFPWDWGGYNGQIALANTVGGNNTRMQIRSATSVDNGTSANPRYTPSYGAWREVVTATKATQMGSGVIPVYVNSSGQITASTSTVGAANRPIFLSGGTLTQGSYTINATINGGTATRVAYYSGANAISSATNLYVLEDYLISNSRNDQTVNIRANGLIIYGQTYGNTATDMLSNTAGVFRFSDGGPQIIFNTSASFNAQAGALIFTDHDSAATGASFHFVTTESSDNNGGNLTVTAPRFRARKGLTIGQNSDNTSYNFALNGSGNIATGYLYINGGAGGIINGAATNGGLNSIRVGDDVWLGDCNQGGIMGMKSTGANCGFWFYNSSGANIAQLYARGSSGDIYSDKPFLAPSTSSSWLDGQRYERGGYNLSDATNTGSYWPWMRQTNTSSGKWFSMGTLNNSWYIIGSATSRTENSYDAGMRFDLSTNRLYANFEGRLYGGSSYVYDRTNTGTATYVNYGAAGLAASAISWFACWNGYELRAISKAEVFNAVRDNGGDGRWVNVAGDTMTGALNFANGTQNKMGDDAYIGDQNVAGHVVIGGLNGASGIRLAAYGSNPAASLIANHTDGVTIRTESGNTWLYIGRDDASATKGVYFPGYGGGWYMQDTTWLRSYNSKKVYVNSSAQDAIYTLGGFVASTPNAFRSVYGNKGFIIRNDQNNVYFMPASNAITGDTWSSYYSYVGLADGYWHFTRAYGAVWNDYAEYRAATTVEPGRVVQDTKNGIMVLTTERLAPGCKVVSDTYGFAIGETADQKTPIAVSGRVLVYPYQDKELYSIGAAVCSAPNGTVDIMTREEIMMYPERIIGTVSEIPNYEVWKQTRPDSVGDGNPMSYEVRVNGRIWIYVR